jgi:hypothetical protein
MAYSLMGIFGINMPLLYGEGDKAFIRLQEEIMRISDDQSLFAWRRSDPPGGEYSGLLARAPGDFADSASIGGLDIDKLRASLRHYVRLNTRILNYTLDGCLDEPIKTTAYTTTSRGIELDLQLQHLSEGNFWEPSDNRGFCVALLACRSLPLVGSEEQGQQIDLLSGVAVCLQRSGELYRRINSGWLLSFPSQTSMLYVINMSERGRNKYGSWTIAPRRICVIGIERRDHVPKIR